MTVIMLIAAVFLALLCGVLLQSASYFFSPAAAGHGEKDLPQRTVSGNMKAVAACAGPGSTARIFRYVGLPDCRIVHSLYTGDRNCTDSCLGYGTCRDLCPLGAIVIDAAGVPRILDECNGCGVCVAECPSGVLRLVPRSADFIVRCVSRAAPETRASFCSFACTACGVCKTAGEGTGISLKDGLAHIDYRAKGDRRAAAKACPTGCIVANKNAFQGKDNSLEWSDRDAGASDANT